MGKIVYDGFDYPRCPSDWPSVSRSFIIHAVPTCRAANTRLQDSQSHNSVRQTRPIWPRATRGFNYKTIVAEFTQKCYLNLVTFFSSNGKFDLKFRFSFVNYSHIQICSALKSTQNTRYRIYRIIVTEIRL